MFASGWFFLVGTIVLSAKERVRFFADWFPGAQFAGIYAGIDAGIYEQAGLEVTVVPFAFGQKPAQLLDAEPDTASVGAIEGYIFLQRRAQGVDLLALVPMLQESPAGFMSVAPLVLTSARDFRGRKIGVHTFAEPLYQWFLRRAGVPEAAVTAVPAQDDLDHLVSGQLDALQGYATEEFVRLRGRVGDRARFLSFRELGFDSYSEILYTTRAQADRHAAVLARFVEATRQGWVEALAQPDRARASIQSRQEAPASAAELTAALEALRPFVAPGGQAPLASSSVEKWVRMQAACREMGFLKTPEAPGDFLFKWPAPPR